MVFEYVNNYGWFSVKNIHSKTPNQNSSCSLSFALLLASSLFFSFAGEREREMAEMSENPFLSSPRRLFIHRKPHFSKQSIHLSSHLSYKKTHIPLNPLFITNYSFPLWHPNKSLNTPSSSPATPKGSS